MSILGSWIFTQLIVWKEIITELLINVWKLLPPYSKPFQVSKWSKGPKGWTLYTHETFDAELLSQRRESPGRYTLGRTGWLSHHWNWRCCSTRGTWGTGGNVLPLHWPNQFMYCWCSQFAFWKCLLSQIWEHCLETQCPAGGPVFPCVPLMALSLQLEMRRLGPGFDHLMGPQYGIIWKPYPIRIWFLGRLIDCSCLPDVSMYFLDENRLSWFKIHAVAGGSTQLSLDELPVDPETFHNLPNRWRDLG